MPENQSLLRRLKAGRFAWLSAVLAVGFLLAWPSPAQAAAVYYSVGTSVADLKTAGTQITIAAGVATFDRAQPNNVGVGDAILYGATTSYISGRTSSTQYSVITRQGATPVDVPVAVAVTSIRRAFNLLSDAETLSTNGTHLGTANLVTGNYQLNWPCYNDGPMNNQVTISGYTTGATNFIKVYTPVRANEVGASQRHTGTARTGFRLQPTSAIDNDSIHVLDAFVRIEGIEIDGSLSTAPNGAGGVWFETVALSPVDHYVSHSIIYETRNFTGIAASSMSAKVWNNVLHRVNNLTLGALSMDQVGGTGYFYNNTVYDCAGKGINENAGTMIAISNASLNNGGAGAFPDFWGGTQSYNVSSDGTATGTGSQINKTAYATYFVSTTVGAEDLHLKASSLSLWTGNGTDLSADANLPVTNDIDRGPRARPDIGADEFAATALFRSVGTNAAALASGGANALTISGSAATFGSGLPNNIGVGDVIQYDSDGDASIDAVAFIHGRTNSQTYTVKNRLGAAPTPVTGDNDWAIHRAYIRLANWESQTENLSINAAVRNFDTSTDLVLAATIMLVACYADGADTTLVVINGWTTGADTYIQIFTPNLSSQVGTTQRHSGAWDATKYRLVAGLDFFGILRIQEEYVRVTGLQIENTNNKNNRPAGIEIDAPTAISEVRISHNILRSIAAGTGDWWAAAVAHTLPGGTLKVWNNIMDNWGSGVFCEYTGVSSDVSIYNNTVVNSDNNGINLEGHASGTYRLANNLVQDATTFNYFFAGGVLPLTYSATNLSFDTSSPDGAAFRNKTVMFVGGADFHLSPADVNAKDLGTNLSADPVLPVFDDIDGGARQAPWDIGADDILATATTAVELMSFEGVAADGAVDLVWTTASELQNLGFHLYRSDSAEGPYTRITSSLIPGLGSSPTGQSYSYQDAGLVNGQTYYYELEDVETTGKTQRHGPVGATPVAGAGSGSGSGGSGGSGDGDSASGSTARITYGRPEERLFRVLERGASYALLELVTPGFYAVPEEDGRVRLEIPGFESRSVPGAPAVPVLQTYVEAVAGRGVRLRSVVASEEVRFDGLRVAMAEAPGIVVSETGAVVAGRVKRQATVRRGLFPRSWSQLLGTSFQGETKKARVELSPLRYDPRTGTTVLAGRLLVRLDFVGVERGERGLGGSRGRRPRPSPLVKRNGLVAELVTKDAGLYAVRFEDVLGGGRGVPSSRLRLSYQGQGVAYHLEPPRALFGPGSVLYFVSEGVASNPWGDAVYALETGQAGVGMATVDGSPSGPSTLEYLDLKEWEQNRYYQAGLLEAKDLWQWDLLVSPVTKSYPFALGQLSSSSTVAHLQVWLQGSSDFEADPDHHVRVLVNGTPVGEMSWDGKTERVIEADLLPGILQEGANTLSLENVGDTAAAYSMVFLNRFSLRYPRLLLAEEGQIQGRFGESGTAEIGGLVAPAFVVDTQEQPKWLSNLLPTAGGVSFRAEAERSYLAVSASVVKAPLVRQPVSSRLRSSSNRADWVLIAPQEFLSTAQPLVDLRRSQGLQVKVVSMEEISQEFGYGESRPEAVKRFLEYAYESWRRPSLRYVVLLGDGSYDPKDYLKTGVKDRIPPYVVKTSYLWTASDPAYGAVNGEDLLPDVAVGRMSAGTVEEARILVEKVVAFETGGRSLSGKAVLIADNADLGGSFEADADEIAASVLSQREVEKVYLRDLQGGTRTTIVAAFDNGPGLVSYVGHGGTAVWASENVFNNTDVASLSPQGQQPLLLTLNCLNGFFHFPPLNSLAEAFLKAEGKGAVAAFSPSGLSLNDAAHVYHHAVLAEIESGRHTRLGDAILAAQSVYADSGAFPELLSIYHLLGDPALRIRY